MERSIPTHVFPGIVERVKEAEDISNLECTHKLLIGRR